MKKVWCFIILLLCCGCSNHEFAIETFVETKNNIVIAMTYPQTGNISFDKIIKDYVLKSYNAFKEEYESFSSLADTSEFNIDYEYWEINNQYSNVVLTTFLSTSSLAHPINEIKTFVFDTKNNKIVKIQDLLTEDNLNKLVPKVKQKLLQEYKDCVLLDSLDMEINKEWQNLEYTIDNNNLNVYFNPYLVTSGNCGIIKIAIPLKEVGLSFTKTTVALGKVNMVNNQRIIDPNKPVIALTFDDGPSKYTDEILDILKDCNANGTFFVLGNKVKAYSTTIQKMINQGNQIGNHSYNHKWLTRLDIDDFKEQIDRTQTIVEEVTGYTPHLLRPTYGSINKKIRNNTDLDIILWDVDSLDWKIKDSKKIADRVLKDVKDLDIVLFHDIKKRTVEALKILLPKLQEQGFQFVTIDELEEVKLLRKTAK